MSLRNLPTGAATSLASLVEAHPVQVSSMALAGGANVGITLLAFAEGEGVSAEEYYGDTLYYLVEGKAVIVLADCSVPIQAGEVLMVPAHVMNDVEADGPFKVLQITVPE